MAYPKNRRMQDPAERFWRRVDRSGECWVWQGCLTGNGYGYLQRGRRGAGRIPAHRMAWLLTYGSEAPGDMDLCHRCDNRRCVRPDHLFPGTRLDNMRDAAAKGRTQRGERHHFAKFTAHDVIDIRSLHAFGARRQALADAFGVCVETIRSVVTGRRWLEFEKTHQPSPGAIGGLPERMLGPGVSGSTSGR